MGVSVDKVLVKFGQRAVRLYQYFINALLTCQNTPVIERPIEYKELRREVAVGG